MQRTMVESKDPASRAGSWAEDLLRTEGQEAFQRKGGRRAWPQGESCVSPVFSGHRRSSWLEGGKGK